MQGQGTLESCSDRSNNFICTNCVRQCIEVCDQCLLNPNLLPAVTATFALFGGGFLVVVAFPVLHPWKFCYICYKIAQLAIFLCILSDLIESVMRDGFVSSAAFDAAALHILCCFWAYFWISFTSFE